MAREPLDPESYALWRRVTDTVRPLRGRKSFSLERSLPNAEEAGVRGSETRLGGLLPVGATFTPTLSLKGAAANKPGLPTNTLDAAWDKRLRTGTVAPDLTIDLHGYTVAAAHAALDAGLTRAVADHVRLILLVTGKPPPPGRSRLDNPLRGVIRASIGDWLHHSRHAGRIAAVRNAHPKHGGAGALYVILRRMRDKA
jgi:DNA-nicking Smr family endonuclease